MKGYTLIEMIISVLLMAIVLLGGTALFYQNLKSSGLSDIDLNLNSSMRSILAILENDLRYSQVLGLDDASRVDCIGAGASGYLGGSLSVLGLDGLESTYVLDNGRVASISSLTTERSYLTPTKTLITKLSFRWFCQGGVSDKIKIEIDASSDVLGSGLKITRSVSTETNLLNSGVN